MSSANSTDPLKRELQDRILTVKINRPGNKNALNIAMYGVLAKLGTKMVF